MKNCMSMIIDYSSPFCGGSIFIFLKDWNEWLSCSRYCIIPCFAAHPAHWFVSVIILRQKNNFKLFLCLLKTKSRTYEVLGIIWPIFWKTRCRKAFADIWFLTRGYQASSHWVKQTSWMHGWLCLGDIQYWYSLKYDMNLHFYMWTFEIALRKSNITFGHP